MSRRHDAVIGVLLVTFAAIAGAAAYSAVFGADVPLQALVVAGAVILGLEPWLRPHRIRVSLAGGVVLVVTGAYAAYVVSTGRPALEDPVVAGGFVVGALLVVVTRSQIRSSIRTAR